MSLARRSNLDTWLIITGKALFYMLLMNERKTKRNKMNEQTVRYLVLLAILVVVCVLLSFATTTFFSLATIKNIINQISVQCIVAIGMTVLI